MSNALVMMASACPETSMVSSVKMLKFLATLLRADTSCWKNPQRVDKGGTLIFVNSSTTFTEDDYREYIMEQVRRCGQMIYVQNDYKLPPHSDWTRILRARKKRLIWWTSVERRLLNGSPGELVDWNRLTFVPRPTYARPKHARVFYYGACRKDRIERLQHYFGKGRLDAIISAPTKPQLKKFNALDLRARIIVDKTDIVTQLREYPLTLYLEDPYSTRNYTCLANRFYEALSAGTAFAIDARCEMTFKRAGLTGYEKYLVETAADVNRLLPHSARIAKEQQRLWGDKDYVGQLEKHVRAVAKKWGVV